MAPQCRCTLLSGGDRPASAGVPPGGRFWAIASASSDEEEEEPSAATSSALSMRYRCQRPDLSPSRNMENKKLRKREVKRRRQRWAASLLCADSPLPSPGSFRSRSVVVVSDHLDPFSQSLSVKNCFLRARKVPPISPLVCENDGDESGWIMVRRRRRNVIPAITGDKGDMSPRSMRSHAITAGINGSLDPNLNSNPPDLTDESLGHRGSLLTKKNIAHQTSHLGHDGVRRNGGRISTYRDRSRSRLGFSAHHLSPATRVLAVMANRGAGHGGIDRGGGSGGRGAGGNPGRGSNFNGFQGFCNYEVGGPSGAVGQGPDRQHGYNGDGRFNQNYQNQFFNRRHAGPPQFGEFNVGADCGNDHRQNSFRGGGRFYGRYNGYCSGGGRGFRGRFGGGRGLAPIVPTGGRGAAVLPTNGGGASTRNLPLEQGVAQTQVTAAASALMSVAQQLISVAAQDNVVSSLGDQGEEVLAAAKKGKKTREGEVF